MHFGHGYRLLFVMLWGLSCGPMAVANESAVPALPSATALPAGRFIDRTLEDSTGPHKYVVYLPPGYSTARRWPVVLFLHGAGERGRDGVSPTYAGLGPVLRHSPGLYPCVVVFPQCETWDDQIFTSWSPDSAEGRRALAILAEVEKAESIDPAHRSLTGWSMGGFGATALGAEDPAHWQSILAISGGHAEDNSEPLRTVPLWLIHGTQDSIVSVEKSQQLAAALQLPTSQSRYDEVAAAGHEVWETVYSDPRVAAWLLAGGSPPEIDWSTPPAPGQLPTAADGAPFVPAATLTQAVTLRIGNDALRMLSAGIPESVPPDKLQGTLPAIKQSFTVDGETYELALTDLTYAAQLESAELSTLATAEIRADLGLRLQLKIGEATLKTRGFHARTAPFRIVIGHRQPVSLNILIKPRVRDQQLELQLQQTRFPIPDHNWYVEMPQEIELSGTKFTRHEIETGIVGGLYTRKKEIEEQVRSVIPPLLDRVEQRLNVDDSGQLTKWLWPFPVYQPRLRWTAEALAVDANGMTVQLGAIVAAINPAAQREPVRRHLGGIRLPEDDRLSTDLHVVVDPQLIEVISEEFTQSGIARINVLDIPETRFHELAQADRLRKVLPELALGSEIRSVLALSSPFQVRGEGSPDGRGGVSHLRIPSAQLEVFSRATSESAWSRAGQFSIALDQPIEIAMTPHPTGPPVIGVHWSDSPEFHMTSSDRVDPQGLIDLERETREAWIGWSQSRNVPPAPAQDLKVGDSRLRLDRLTLDPQSIGVKLKGPPAQLTVAGDAPLTYRVRGRNAYWSYPRTLAPGESHRFDITDPIEWEIINSPGEKYTLRPGEVARWDQATDVTYEPPRIVEP